jgi:hypothetical protein
MGQAILGREQLVRRLKLLAVNANLDARSKAGHDVLSKKELAS